MKARLTNIFGLKLLPVSGEMTSTAKDMLDKEIEYIDYLRNRKKFFFMTQVQQTRVHVVAKRKKKKEDPNRRRRGGLLWFPKRRKKKVRVKKTLKEKVKQQARIKGKKVNKNVRKGLENAFRKPSAQTSANNIKRGPVRSPVKKPKIPAFAGKGRTATSTLTKPKQVTKTLQKVIPPQARKKVVEKVMSVASRKTLQKASAKTATKVLGKTMIKTGIKKVPILGAIAGLGFGVQRLLSGDPAGALMEVASGVASTIPGAGTAISIGIDSALIAKDLAPKQAKACLKDGGEVSSPTQALIAEGGEPELVVPHSKLGPVFQSLLRQVGTVLTDVTTGFLATLPVPSSRSQAVSAESAKLAAVFGGKSTPLSIFKGSKIKKAAAGFLKKAAGGAMSIAKTAFKMTPVVSKEKKEEGQS